MPERSGRVARPRDPSEPACQIMLESTGQAPKFNPTEEKPVDSSNNPDAVALGRLGGLNGRPARAEALNPRKRSQIAAKVRWGEKS